MCIPEKLIVIDKSNLNDKLLRLSILNYIVLLVYSGKTSDIRRKINNRCWYHELVLDANTTRYYIHNCVLNV